MRKSLLDTSILIAASCLVKGKTAREVLEEARGEDLRREKVLEKS